MPKSLLMAVFCLLTAAGCSDAADTTRDGDSAARREVTERDRSNDPALSCGITATTPLTPAGIGELRVGMSVAQARARCRVLKDSVGEAEGMAMPLLIVDLGSDTILAEPANDQIFRLRIDGPAFRTAEGLGVGSTIAELRAAGTAIVAMGEGTFIMLREKCGLSFQLGELATVGGATVGPDMSAADFAPGNRVARVLVYGCDQTRTAPSSP